QEIIIDGGSGIINADVKSEHTDIFLSHLHTDHLVGLPMYPGLSVKGHSTDILLPSFLNENVKGELRRIIDPPFWPLGLEDYPGDVVIKEFTDTFKTGVAKIDVIEGNHPGGCGIFSISIEDKRIIYATDYEHDEEGDKALCDFASDADLLIYDGAYTDEEYEKFRNFGHSTPRQGIRIAKAAGVERLLITHHSPAHDDDFLRSMESDLKNEFKGISFAKEGEIIII
ncbi:MAG: hypothetical protein K6F00_04455, partial [Lachnospiraceae bacterium]|nr:hypothetical protein [Lachnospiraceae bacterium]